MSEKELNSYRFLSGEDPTDEMLQAIMDDARDEAVKKAKSAQMKLDTDYNLQYERALKIWGDRLNSAQNGVF